MSALNASVRAAFLAAPGFMPEHEGLALHAAAVEAATHGPLLEVGSWCGRSTLLLAAAAAAAGTHVITVDHHRGSEEHQPGEAYHDPSLVDADGHVDTLGTFRGVIASAGMEPHVIAVVAPSAVVGQYWRGPLGMVFIDGGHSETAAQTDYETWAHHIVIGGTLAIHDVFASPRDGGQAPFHVYERALASGSFTEAGRADSLRILRRTAD